MEKQTAQTSESVMLDNIFNLAGAGASVIQLRTREPLRAAASLRKSLLSSNSEYREWDVVNGERSFTLENCMNHAVGGGDNSDLFSSLSGILTRLRMPDSELVVGDTSHYFIYVDPHPFIAGNPNLVELLLHLSTILPTTNTVVILVTDQSPLAGIHQGSIMVTNLETPSAAELADSLRTFLDRSIQDMQADLPDGILLEDFEYDQLAQLGLGLSQFEFDTHVALSAMKCLEDPEITGITYEALSDGITAGKIEVVRQSEILELSKPVDISEVGGMANLKDWLHKRRDCFSEEAREFGVEPPKGFSLVGVPGTGKSLVAKATSAVLGIPLVRLDMGRVFSKYVGDSESRIRAALEMVEAMAPCVLFVDEIDKGLGGAEGGGGDSGTSSRVLGSFLTWLQETKAPVFTLVTANRVSGLPPELLRHGRFDQNFAIGLPTSEECVEVLGIHLRKRGKSDEFTSRELQDFRLAVGGYVPAEIEAAVKNAIVDAFSEDEELSMAHIIDSLRSIVPMSVSNKVKIDAMIEWADKNAMSVSRREVPAKVSSTAAAAGRVIRRPGARNH